MKDCRSCKYFQQCYVETGTMFIGDDDYYFSESQYYQEHTCSEYDEL